MSLLQTLFHTSQALASAYTGTFSAIAIFSLQKREKQTEHAAQYLNTAAQQLHKTRTTQTSGALATIASLVSGVVLATRPPSGQTAFLLSAGNALGLVFAYHHLSNFWKHKAKVPFVNDYNDGITASNNLRRLLAGLAGSWGLAAAFYALGVLAFDA